MITLESDNKISEVRAYSRKYGHACDFPEEGGGKGKKEQNILKFGQKCTKFDILKKGSLMRATIACIKQLQYALEVWTFLANLAK